MAFSDSRLGTPGVFLLPGDAPAPPPRSDGPPRPAPPPPAGPPAERVVVYQRPRAGDRGADGSLDRPFRTLRAALEAWPLDARGRTYVLDRTGCSDVLPVGFTLRAYQDSRAATRTGAEAAFNLLAEGVALALIERAGAPVANPRSRLVSVRVPGATWPGGQWAGRQLVGKDGVIVAIAGNDADTLQLCADAVPALPWRIVEPGATLVGEGGDGAAAALALGPTRATLLLGGHRLRGGALRATASTQLTLVGCELSGPIELRELRAPARFIGCCLRGDVHIARSAVALSGCYAEGVRFAGDAAGRGELALERSVVRASPAPLGLDLARLALRRSEVRDGRAGGVATGPSSTRAGAFLLSRADLDLENLWIDGCLGDGVRVGLGATAAMASTGGKNRGLGLRAVDGARVLVDNDTDVNGALGDLCAGTRAPRRWGDFRGEAPVVVEADVSDPGRSDGSRVYQDATAAATVFVDTTSLGSSFNLDGGAERPPGLTRLALVPRRYRFASPASANGFDFEVTMAGLVDYDASLDAYVEGRGTRTLAVVGLPVTVDATALGSNFNLDYNAVANRDFPPGAADVRVLPGEYLFCSPSSAVGFRFQVTATGTIDYDAALDAYVTGRGTRTLTVLGLPITIDPTALGSNFNLDYNAVTNRDYPPQATDFRLLPGPYLFCSPSSAVGFRFQVTEGGTIDYDAALDAYVTGRGTRTLTVLGLPITIDSTSLGSNFNLDYNAVTNRDYPPQATDFRLLPGPYLFCSPSSAVGLQFQVTEAGTIDYDPKYDALLTGRGTRTLTVLGLPITIDPTALAQGFDLDYSAVTNRDYPPQATDLRLLPGPYLFCSPPSTVGFQFQVTGAGTIDYDPRYDHLLTGRGTTALTVLGLPVTIDTGALPQGFDLDYGAIAGHAFPAGTTDVVLLPGPYLLCSPPSTVGFGFTVAETGLVDYDAAFDAFLRGRGTTRLTVLGLPVAIDATALPSDFDLDDSAIAGQTFSRAAVATVPLLPGPYAFCSPPSTVAVAFQVTAAGTLDYDAAFDRFLAGRGSTQLTVLGLPITFDAAALPTDFCLDGAAVGNRSYPAGLTTIPLLPGSYGFASPPGVVGFGFEVSAAGVVDYDASLDPVLEGRGTSTLRILGATVTIDASALAADFVLDGGAVGGRSYPPAPTPLALLPGTYGLTSGAASLEFQVTAAGLVDYDAALDPVLAGRGTRTLTVTGALA